MNRIFSLFGRTRNDDHKTRPPKQLASAGEEVHGVSFKPAVSTSTTHSKTLFPDNMTGDDSNSSQPITSAEPIPQPSTTSDAENGAQDDAAGERAQASHIMSLVQPSFITKVDPSSLSSDSRARDKIPQGNPVELNDPRGETSLTQASASLNLNAEAPPVDSAAKWQDYRRRTQEIASLRIEAEEKRGVSQTNRKLLHRRHNSFNRSLLRLQAEAWNQKLLDKLREESFRLTKALEELDVSDAAVDKAESDLVQSEFQLLRETPTSLSHDFAGDPGFAFSRELGFDFPGDVTDYEELDSRAEASLQETSDAGSLIARLDAIGTLEDQIVDIQAKKAAVVQQTISSPVAEPAVMDPLTAILDTYDNQETESSQALASALADLETYRVSMALQDGLVNIERMPESLGPNSTEPSSSLSTHANQLGEVLAAIKAECDVVYLPDRLRGTDTFVNRTDYVNCWLLHQLQSSNEENRLYLSEILAEAQEAAVIPEADDLLRLWFHDGTYKPAPQHIPRLGTNQNISMNTNAPDSGRVSRRASNLSLQPLESAMRPPSIAEASSSRGSVTKLP